ncbi:MAG: hypothetical protein ACK4N6_00415 [Rhodocyclaceae bacterium]
MQANNKLIGGLTLIALIAMIAAYFTPIWWVSLTAPNYPKDAFPDGIRIHFHFDGVYNGCKAAGKGSRMAEEVIQSDISGSEERYNPVLEKQKKADTNAQGLDCVHEMNTINHYVGMFPIATGAPVEKPLSKFFIAFFAVMLAGFICTDKKRRMIILTLGFAAVAAWAIVDQYVLGHLEAHVKEYMNETGTFFREPEKIQVWGDNVRRITGYVIGGMIVAMLVVLMGIWKFRKFELMLALVPALLPIYFIIEYSGWLWFFGHNLHPWGAFTVKPFMPTVFGEGKVAQFSTYSYPYWGFGLLLVVFVCLMLALLMRRKQLNQQAED